MMAAVLNCRRLLTHRICCALVLVEASAGNRRAARMAMMAMTTSNSINVNAPAAFLRVFIIAPVRKATSTGSDGQWILSQRGEAVLPELLDAVQFVDDAAVAA